MHCPSTIKLLLILPASFSLSPVVWVLTTRSLPARSTMLNRLVASAPVARLVRTSLSVKIECERDEARLARVLNTRRFDWPRARTPCAS